MSDDGLLGRAELERAFSALGDRLFRRGVVADLFVVGGAAMALAYDADRVTSMTTSLAVHLDHVGAHAADNRLWHRA